MQAECVRERPEGRRIPRQVATIFLWQLAKEILKILRTDECVSPFW